MRSDSKYFCVLPWVHMNVNPDGFSTLCCQSHEQIRDSDNRLLNLQTHSLDGIWNSDGMKAVRRSLSGGEPLTHCNACYNNEKFGRLSYRQHSNQRWLENDSRAAAIRQAIETSQDGTASQTPTYFDLRLGNVCNLKCTACKPLYSSQIERDRAHAPWITDAPYQRFANRFGTEGDWSEAPQLLEEIVGLSGDLSLIQLAGGEPTINKTQISLLETLCETGQAGHIDLEVVTNLSNVRGEIYKTFSRFRSLSVALSIDGTDETYEYVRFPGKWQSVVRNVKRLREACPGARIAINAVLQATNAMNMVDLFDWAAAEEIPINLSIGRGLDQYNDFRILPKPVRDMLRQRFDEYFARASNRDIAGSRQNIQSIFEEMDATDFSEPDRRARALNFMQFVNDMDKSRGLSFKAVAPEVYDGVASYLGGWNEATRYA